MMENQLDVDKGIISRKGFLVGAGMVMASAAGLGLSGCTSDNATSGAGEAKGALAVKADKEIETDVLVVGLGASGLMAAYGAGNSGAKVIGIDTAASMEGVTNVRTSGAWAVGSKLQQDDPKKFGIQEAMDYINSHTNYQANQKTLRAILGASGRAIDVLSGAGMPWDTEFSVGKYGDPDSAEIKTRGIHWYGCKGADRAAIFQKFVDSVGVECLFGTTASDLLVEDGKVVGVRCTSDEGTIDIRAQGIVLTTGGFLGNPDMVAEYFAGGSIVNMGNPNSTGVGVRMALEAGAQSGMCFSVSGGEYGGANQKASMPYAFRPDSGTNDAMRLPVLGGLLVDAEGGRFINEGFVNTDAMFAGESFIREKYYYALADQAYVDRLASEPVSDFYGDGRMKGMFEGVVLTDIESHLEKAVEEGWAYQANSIEELAEGFGHDESKLSDTVSQYNEFCARQQDDLFFKDSKYLQPLDTPPYYIVESQASGWVSLGGIKTNELMQALDSDGHFVPSVYVAGSNADIYTSPLYLTASENGFSLASGLIAGESVAEYALGESE